MPMTMIPKLPRSIQSRTGAESERLRTPSPNQFRKNFGTMGTPSLVAAPSRHLTHPRRAGTAWERLRRCVFGSQSCRQQVVQGVQRLHDHPGIAENGHEIGITMPTGHGVPVEMAPETGAG